jgi:hypothetical protein
MVSIEPADAAHTITQLTVERLSLQRDGLLSSAPHLASIAANANCGQPLPHLFAAAGNTRQDIPLGPNTPPVKTSLPFVRLSKSPGGKESGGDRGAGVRRASS